VVSAADINACGAALFLASFNFQVLTFIVVVIGFHLLTFWITRQAYRDGNGSVGHGSNGSPFLDGSHGSYVTTFDPLTHDNDINAHCPVTCNFFVLS